MAGHSNSPISGSKSENPRGNPDWDSDGDGNADSYYYDYWVVKIDASGNNLWDKVHGGTLAETAYHVLANTDGTFMLMGISQSGATGNKTDAILALLMLG